MIKPAFGSSRSTCEHSLNENNTRETVHLWTGLIDMSTGLFTFHVVAVVTIFAGGYWVGFQRGKVQPR